MRKENIYERSPFKSVASFTEFGFPPELKHTHTEESFAFILFESALTQNGKILTTYTDKSVVFLQLKQGMLMNSLAVFCIWLFCHLD